MYMCVCVCMSEGVCACVCACEYPVLPCLSGELGALAGGGLAVKALP